jgi:hypothetical protein
MAHDLACDEPTDGSGADDHGVLDVGHGATTQRTRAGAEQRDADDCAQPEDDEAIEGQLEHAGRVRQHEEHPGADRRHLKDLRDLVDRGMVGSFAVAVVQSVQLHQDDPEGDGGGGKNALPQARKALSFGGGRDARDQEGDREPDDVRQRQGAA